MEAVLMTAIKEAVQDLSQRASDCAELAKMQRKGADAQQHRADAQQEGADHQHDEARKLEQLGEALKKDVAEIKEKLAKTSGGAL
jgi:hypothetical protein